MLYYKRKRPNRAEIASCGVTNSERKMLPPTNTAHSNRMKANRASAATSREKKRKYLENLEEIVKELSATANKLRHENHFWRSLYEKEDDIGDFTFVTLLRACEHF